MKYSRPIWQLMEECGRAMPATFRFAQVWEWFGEHYPDVTDLTVRAHLAGLTEGSRSRHPNFADRTPIFRRISRGEYECVLPPSTSPADSASTDSASDASDTQDSGTQGSGQTGTKSVVLFALASGKQLKASERKARLKVFADSRRRASHNGESWFALSSHYGLIPDSDPSPASLQMGPIPESHGDTWATWVTIRLESAIGDLAGTSIHIDAPEQYGELLRPVLQSRGAHVA